MKTLHTLNKALALTLLLSTAAPMFAALDINNLEPKTVQVEGKDKDVYAPTKDGFKKIVEDAKKEVEEAKKEKDSKKREEALEAIQKDLKSVKVTTTDENGEAAEATFDVQFSDEQQKEIDALFAKGYFARAKAWTKENPKKAGFAGLTGVTGLTALTAWALGYFDEDQDSDSDVQEVTEQVTPQVVTKLQAINAKVQANKTVTVDATLPAQVQAKLAAPVADYNKARSAYVTARKAPKATTRRRSAKRVSTRNTASTRTARTQLTAARNTLVATVNSLIDAVRSQETTEVAEQSEGFMATVKKYGWQAGTVVAAVTGVIAGELLKQRGHGITDYAVKAKNRVWTSYEDQIKAAKDEESKLPDAQKAEREAAAKKIKDLEEAKQKAEDAKNKKK